MNLTVAIVLANLSALLALASCLLTLRRQRQLLGLFGCHLNLAQVHSDILMDLNKRLDALEKEPWK